MSSIKMGVIGVGSMGRNHARVCASLPGVELVYVCDTDPKTLDSVAGEYGCAATVNPSDLIGQVDAVSVVAPTSEHFRLGQIFLANGIHVLMEKPVTAELEEARALVALDEKLGGKVVFQVGHLERFNPAVLKLKEMLDRPMLLEAHRLSAPTTRNLDVGISWDLMIHDYDLLLSLLNDEVDGVNAQGISVYSEHEDIASVQLQFRNGVQANLVASRNSSERSRGLKVTQADGSIIIVDYIGQTLKVSHLDGSGKPAPLEEIPVEKAEPLKLELADFVRCVREGGRPAVSCQDGLKAVELACRVRERMNIVKMSR